MMHQLMQIMLLHVLVLYSQEFGPVILSHTFVKFVFQNKIVLSCIFNGMTSSLDILIKVSLLTSIFIFLITITGKIHSNLAETSEIGCTDCNISNETVIVSDAGGAGHCTQFFLQVTNISIYFVMQAMDRLLSILKASVGFNACILVVCLLLLHLRAELSIDVVHLYIFDVFYHCFSCFLFFHFVYFEFV